MAAGVIEFVGRLRAVLGPDAADAELVRSYAHDHDAEAFAALVRRHGPMVWATCLRTVGDRHAAEDAFQATFLVLVRKAGGLRPAHSLGGYLHAVAVNVSVRARTAADRRKRRQAAAVEPAAPEPPEPADERALAMLDEEVERLPAKLRDAVVLCELEGVSRKDAAARLGVPEGTLSSRLAAARKRLAEKLRGRGVTPELLALPAAVPAGLADAACGLGAGAVPAPAVLALAGGAMRAMLLKALGVGAMTCGLLAAGGRAMDEPPAKPADPPKAVVAEPAAGPDVITVREGNGFVVLTPDGKRVRDEKAGVYGYIVRVSPDGKQVAFSEAASGPPTDWNGYARRTVVVVPAGGDPERPSALFRVHAEGLFWAADGHTLIATEKTMSDEPAERDWVSYRLDPVTRSVRPLRLPGRFLPLGERPGGGWVGVWSEVAGRTTKEHLASLAGPAAKPEKLAELTGRADNLRLSPDGGRVLFEGRDPADPPAPKGQWPLTRLFVYDLAARTRARLPGVPTDAYLVGFCWSPDGKRVAYTWKRAGPDVTFSLSVETIDDPRHKNTTDAFLTVMDTDGGNRRDIRSARGDTGSTVNLAELDWR